MYSFLELRPCSLATRFQAPVTSEYRQDVSLGRWNTDVVYELCFGQRTTTVCRTVPLRSPAGSGVISRNHPCLRIRSVAIWLSNFLEIPRAHLDIALRIAKQTGRVLRHLPF